MVAHPTLSNIPPPDIRRQHTLLKEFNKILANEDLPQDLSVFQTMKLVSRHPPLQSALSLFENDFDLIQQILVTTTFHDTRDNARTSFPCIETQPPGFELLRRL